MRIIPGVMIAAVLLGGCASTGVESARGSVTPSMETARDSVTGADRATVAALDTTDRTAEMAVGGFLGGLIGFGVGTVVGVGLETTLASECFEYCGIAGGLLGAMGGEVLGMAFGVHTANKRRGNFLAALTGPVLVGLGAIAGLSMLGDWPIHPGVLVIAIPTAQIITSIEGERSAMPKPLPAPDPDAAPGGGRP